MTNDESQEIILEVLAFCKFEEIPRHIDSSGSMQYRTDLSYGKSRRSFKHMDGFIWVCDPTFAWYPLKPLYSLDDCAFFITRISHIIHEYGKYPGSEKEAIVFNELYNEVSTTLLDLMRTLSPEMILNGIYNFIQKAKRKIAKLD